MFQYYFDLFIAVPENVTFCNATMVQNGYFEVLWSALHVRINMFMYSFAVTVKQITGNMYTTCTDERHHCCTVLSDIR